MLYIFVNEEQTEVLYATYDIQSAKKFCQYKHVELAARYFSDVEIYAVKEYQE